MQLTTHFTLEEFYKSETAVRRGIINKPGPQPTVNLMRVAEGMEKVRALLGKPISISSGYRCLALNRAIGSRDDSAHVQGFAADFSCWNFGSPETIVHAIEQSDIKFDQLIMEGNWVHISFAPTMRQETLTAVFDSQGKVKYFRRPK